jgi:hypothetical protein
MQTAPAISGKITPMQIKLIGMGRSQLGLPDEDYYKLLSDRYWCNSCKDLTYKEASELIDHFKTMGFKIKSSREPQPPRGRRPRGAAVANNIANLPSKEQLRYIELLRADIRWHLRDGYYHWLVKWLKKDSIATSREASRVIEGLKGMLKRQEDNKVEG